MNNTNDEKEKKWLLEWKGTKSVRYYREQLSWLFSYDEQIHMHFPALFINIHLSYRCLYCPNYNYYQQVFLIVKLYTTTICKAAWTMLCEVSLLFCPHFLMSYGYDDMYTYQTQRVHTSSLSWQYVAWKHDLRKTVGDMKSTLTDGERPLVTQYGNYCIRLFIKQRWSLWTSDRWSTQILSSF